MPIMNIVPLSDRLLVSAQSLVAYLGKMAVPLNLVPFYPYPRDVSLASSEYIVPIVLLTGITTACLFVVRSQKLWLAAWSYFVITLIPVIGVIQVGGQAMADRYTYLLSLGPFAVIGVVTAGAYERITELKRQRMLSQIAALCIVLTTLIAISFVTTRQISIWKDKTSFWSYVIEKEPERFPMAYYNLGNTFAYKGQYDKAIELYQKALRLNPDYAEAHYNLATQYLKTGQVDKATDHYKAASRLTLNRK